MIADPHRFSDTRFGANGASASALTPFGPMSLQLKSSRTSRRACGPVPVSVFEVLLPDVPEAAQVVLIGEPGRGADERGPAATGELARFVLPF